MYVLFFAAFLDFINMDSENKKVWSRLETHEEWKSRIEKELRERKEQEKAKLEIENELRKQTERKTAKLKKKKELQKAKMKLEEIENHENDMDYRFTKKKKELPHEAKVKLEKIEISENDVDYRFTLENRDRLSLLENKNSKDNEKLKLEEIKIHENDLDYRFKLETVNSKDSENNNDYKLIPIKKEPNDESELIMSPIDIDNEIEHLLSQEVRNLYSGLQIKTFQVLDYFDPTYRLIIFRESHFFTFLSDKLQGNST